MEKPSPENCPICGDRVTHPVMLKKFPSRPREVWVVNHIHMEDGQLTHCFSTYGETEQACVENWNAIVERMK